METKNILLIITATWLLVATHLAEREVIRDKHAGWEAVIRALLWPLSLTAKVNANLEARLTRIRLQRMQKRSSNNLP